MAIALVTGGAGFLGRHLVEVLANQGTPVRALDVVSAAEFGSDRRVEYRCGDICDPAVTQAACNDVDVIYHTAALVPLAKAGRDFFRVDTKGTAVLCDAALRAGVKKLVHLSSSSVYGIPQHVPLSEDSPLVPLGQYGQAKYRAEQVCEAFQRRGLPITILRPRPIVGIRRLGIFHILYDWIWCGRRIYVLGRGEHLFQFVSARDVVAACLLAAERGAATVYNVGASNFGTLREALQGLIDHAATGARLVSLPATPARYTLALLDVLGLSPLADWHYQTLDKPFYFDITKAQRELGWQPQDSNVSMLIESYDWYVRNRGVVDQWVGVNNRLAPRQGILKWLRRLS